jgi:hypothetical protein
MYDSALFLDCTQELVLGLCPSSKVYSKIQFHHVCKKISSCFAGIRPFISSLILPLRMYKQEEILISKTNKIAEEIEQIIKKLEKITFSKMPSSSG